VPGAQRDLDDPDAAPFPADRDGPVERVPAFGVADREAAWRIIHSLFSYLARRGVDPDDLVSVGDLGAVQVEQRDRER